MSVASSSWGPKYTPAQLECVVRIKEIRARQKAAMDERLRKEAERLRLEREAAQARRDAAEAATRERIRQIQIAAIEQEKRLRAKREFDEISQGRGLIPFRRVKATAERIAKVYGIEAERILGDGRSGNLPAARAHLTVVLCVENPYTSIASVAKSLGGRDHTTALYHLSVYNEATGSNIRGIKLRRKKRVNPIRFLPLDPPDEMLLLKLMEA